jgi:hypothetical protein
VQHNCALRCLDVCTTWCSSTACMLIALSWSFYTATLCSSSVKTSHVEACAACALSGHWGGLSHESLCGSTALVWYSVLHISSLLSNRAALCSTIVHNTKRLCGNALDAAHTQVQAATTGLRPCGLYCSERNNVCSVAMNAWGCILASQHNSNRTRRATNPPRRVRRCDVYLLLILTS